MLINNNIDFKKSNFKSPIGNGIFDIYINEQSTLLYKKIRNKKFINDIEIYKNIINDVINDNILKEYIHDIKNIVIENDGSYFCSFIKNNIRLYDINKDSDISDDNLIKIKNAIINMKIILNKYCEKNKLKGDWALHNLLYCFDTNKIYNVDIEGFYTYPYIHNNGNCDIGYFNKRVDDLTKIIDNKI